MIDWSLLQVEPDGEFVPELLHILDERETHLRTRTIFQLKVQWNHFEADEAPWENESTIR